MRVQALPGPEGLERGEKYKIGEIVKDNPELAGKEEAIDRVLDNKQEEWKAGKSADEKFTMDSAAHSLNYNKEKKTFVLYQGGGQYNEGYHTPLIEFTLDEVETEQKNIKEADDKGVKAEESKAAVKDKYRDLE